MMCAGSSEPSLVANSISTQISYISWFKFCMYLQEVKWTTVLLWERERKKCFFFIFLFLFDTSVTFYASMFVIVARSCIAVYVILSSIFFSRR